ncbi:phosphate ABC transporter membrane protein 1 (PhoT family) [Hasllibacter halocynthiae]|uniref:Phosphate transport system permease protein n=1 Tax=Hasllibacter halocynthiae TaxID=595589 RepID=A0A2T0X8A5_9RHOB|nr:phosphate ABC transporter permease subunit PstC [Hasllibacter halocynthiae]PRY95135.1 phosphate ABC transporter membrane protein 1 (PhoT family) [Hasllibacter halocynthiae]
MTTGTILIALLALAVVGYFLGRGRAVASAGGDVRRLHSLPRFYGLNVALTTLIPALAVLAVGLLALPIWTDLRVGAAIGPSLAGGDAGRQSLLIAQADRLAEGLEGADANVAAIAALDDGALAGAFADAGIAVREGTDPSILRAALARVGTQETGSWMLVLLVGLAGVVGALVALRASGPAFRARNAVERAILGVLILASTIAIVTTAGIVLSMLFETINFLRAYPAADFFFGTVWNPRFSGDSQLGLLPLLWGTMYVSLVALIVAVPVGLLAAIYMSEYAGPRVRAVAKPLLEILAGIPTIVYGLFALVTVGPLLRDWFAQPLGLGNSASSVMTAGLVMGVMLIPFVSSLSDDVINAVPQSMRDGSLGLGATKSETIRQVVVPAALPGIVGSILLAASRAIGETMIVVLGAGAAAQMDLNPFEAMTTITVKIVSQLVGDNDFNSPETLVAFALGLTLFVMTLALNVLALWIVRRYREQYE